MDCLVLQNLYNDLMVIPWLLWEGNLLAIELSYKTADPVHMKSCLFYVPLPILALPFGLQMLQPLKFAPVEFESSNGIIQWWTARTCTVICEYDRYPEDVFYSWSSLTLQALLDYERFKTGIPVPGSSQRGGQIDGPYLGGDNQGTVSPATPSSQVWIYATSKWANPLAPFITSFCRRLETQCCISPLWVARVMHFQGPYIFV